MPPHDVIVIGASAGGVEALIHLSQVLPGDLPASVFVVIHTAPNAPGLLPKVLGRYSAMPTLYPGDGEIHEYSKIYIAPPNHHMLLEPCIVRLNSGPRVNLFRPAVDTLFRSAAQVYGPRVIGVLLSGTRSDGTAGLQAIQQSGGVTIVQDPKEAPFPGMPLHAIQNVQVNYILSLNAIAQKLQELADQPQPPKKLHNATATPTAFDCTQEENVNGSDPFHSAEATNNIVQQDKQQFESGNHTSPRTTLTCPDCGGVLWEVQENKLVRYACHVGHSYTEESLQAGQSEALEEALWVAVRALEERASFAQRLASRAVTQGHNKIAEKFEKQADEAKHNADLVRQIIVNGKISDMNKDNDGEDGSEA